MLGGDQLTHVSSAILQVTLYPSLIGMHEEGECNACGSYATAYTVHMQGGHEHMESMRHPPMDLNIIQL